MRSVIEEIAGGLCLCLDCCVFLLYGPKSTATKQGQTQSDAKIPPLVLLMLRQRPESG